MKKLLLALAITFTGCSKEEAKPVPMQVEVVKSEKQKREELEDAKRHHEQFQRKLQREVDAAEYEYEQERAIKQQKADKKTLLDLTGD